MKKVLKKGKVVFCLCISFIMIFKLMCFNVGIANAQVKWEKGIDTGYKLGSGTEITIMKVNGNTVYCLEPDKFVSTTKGYEIRNHNFTQEQWQRLNLIAHFGYNKKNNSNADYAATQIFIWKEIYKWQGAYDIPSLDKATVPNLHNRIAKIEEDIREYQNMINSIPSFANNNIEIVANRSIQIKDENGVLNKYPYRIKFVSEGIKADIDKEKNILNIEAENSVSSGNVILEIPEENLVTENIYYYHPSSQDVSTLGFIQSHQVKIDFKVNGVGKLKVNKISENNRPIKDVEFELAGVDFDYQKRVKTDENGEIYFEDLQEGNYILKEIYAPMPYEISVKEDNITIERDVVREKTYINYMQRGRLKLVKVSDTGNMPLKGAEYRIWSESEDFEGVKIEFDENLKTDENGEILVENLPIGKYFYQEIKAPDGYLLDDKVYSFEITFKENGENIIEEIRSNKEPLGKIQLIKDIKDKDKMNNETKENTTLQGAVYGLFAKNEISSKDNSITYFAEGEKVGEFITNKEGVSNIIDSLPMGNYYIKELKAPNGCYLDENMYDVSLEYKGDKEYHIEKIMKVYDEFIPIKPKAPRTKDVFPLEVISIFLVIATMGIIYTAKR